MSRYNEYERLTFMSWDNPDLKEGKTIRAIALCGWDSGDWFTVAINAVRDGQMGEKDENGVYERKWWGDAIWNDSDATNIRRASIAEVNLYLRYVTLEEAADITPGDEIIALIKSASLSEVIVKRNR